MLIMVALKRRCNFARQYSVRRAAIVRQRNRSWPAAQAVPSAAAGLGCPASLRSRFPGAAPALVTAASAFAKQALQRSAVLRAVVTQPLPRWSHPQLLSSNRWAIHQHLGQPKRLGRGHAASGRPLPTAALVLGPTRYAVCWRRTQYRFSALQLVHCGCHSIPVTCKTAIQKWSILH